MVTQGQETICTCAVGDIFMRVLGVGCVNLNGGCRFYEAGEPEMVQIERKWTSSRRKTSKMGSKKYAIYWSEMGKYSTHLTSSQELFPLRNN